MKRFMRKTTGIRRLLGILLATAGAVLIIRMVPLATWYIVLSLLIMGLLLMFFLYERLPKGR